LAATDKFHKKVDELIKENQWITERGIAAKLGISQEHVNHIIAVLQYQKVCARWVARMLTAGMKASRVEVCQQLLSCYGRMVRNFFTAS
jgi:predicted HTH transcriptional regulator